MKGNKIECHKGWGFKPCSSKEQGMKPLVGSIKLRTTEKKYLVDVELTTPDINSFKVSFLRRELKEIEPLFFGQKISIHLYSNSDGWLKPLEPESLDSVHLKLPGIIPDTIKKDLMDHQDLKINLAIGEIENAVFPVITETDWMEMGMKPFNLDLDALVDKALEKYGNEESVLHNKDFARALKKSTRRGTNILVNQRWGNISIFNWEKAMRKTIQQVGSVT